ncbi:hypothetical protein K8R33_02705 [archaeon]|nr:hypothetical protein [archaeon]
MKWEHYDKMNIKGKLRDGAKYLAIVPIALFGAGCGEGEAPNVDRYIGRNYEINLGGHKSYGVLRDSLGEIVHMRPHPHIGREFTTTGKADSCWVYTLSDSATFWINRLQEASNRLEFHLDNDIFHQRQAKGAQSK